MSALDVSTGQALNVYPSSHPISSSQPEMPWAVYLTDDDGRYRLLCFDLDTKTHGSGRAAVDADQLARLARHMCPTLDRSPSMTMVACTYPGPAGLCLELPAAHSTRTRPPLHPWCRVWVWLVAP